jgi:hypothetical protein
VLDGSYAARHRLLNRRPMRETFELFTHQDAHRNAIAPFGYAVCAGARPLNAARGTKSESRQRACKH